MFIDRDGYKFNISLTREPYPKKPDKKDFNKIIFERQEVSIDDFVGAIECGYGYTYIYNQRNFHIRYKTKENFKYTKVLAFDIDDTDCDFETALNNCVYQPTIAYRTYSDGEDNKCSYRFIYVFEDYINTLNFHEIYHKIAIVNRFKDLDIREYNQFYFGTDKLDSYVSYMIYRLEDFNIEQSNYNTHSELIPSEDGTYYTFPDEYYEVKRLWGFDPISKRRFIRKYTDEGKLSRRKQLFIDGQLLKKINNITSIDTMYKVLKNELRIYYDNSIDTITDDELRDIARRVIQYPFKCKICEKHPQFRINVPYWKELMNKENKVYKPIVAINTIRKKIQYSVFKNIYNKALSYKENMQNMIDNNLKISKMTYYRYLKDMKNENPDWECNTSNISVSFSFKEEARVSPPAATSQGYAPTPCNISSINQDINST